MKCHCVNCACNAGGLGDFTDPATWTFSPGPSINNPAGWSFDAAAPSSSFSWGTIPWQDLLNTAAGVWTSVEAQRTARAQAEAGRLPLNVASSGAGASSAWLIGGGLALVGLIALVALRK